MAMNFGIEDASHEIRLSRSRDEKRYLRPSGKSRRVVDANVDTLFAFGPEKLVCLGSICDQGHDLPVINDGGEERPSEQRSQKLVSII